MLFKPADFLILIPAFGAVAAAFFLVYSGAGNADAVHVKGEGGEWIFPADAHETVNVSGPLGGTQIKIKDGAARVVSSPCKNQLCIAAGTIHSRGQWAACLPNRVMVYIGGETPPETGRAENEAGVDAAAW